MSDSGEAVVESGLVVLKFTATWCGPCKHMAPTIDKLAVEFPTVEFRHIDIDTNGDLATKHSVRAVPTLVFIKNGEEVKRVVGASLIGPLRSILKDMTSG